MKTTIIKQKVSNKLFKAANQTYICTKLKNFMRTKTRYNAIELYKI